VRLDLFGAAGVNRRAVLNHVNDGLRSLEIRERALAQKTDSAEKWLQETLAVTSSATSA